MNDKDRLTRLEIRVERGFRHLYSVIATEREIVQNSFDRIQITLLEQNASTRAALASHDKAIQDLVAQVGQLAEKQAASHAALCSEMDVFRAAMTEQQKTIDAAFQKQQEALIAVANGDALPDAPDAPSVSLADLAADIADIKRRLDVLESPPAA